MGQMYSAGTEPSYWRRPSAAGARAGGRGLHPLQLAPERADLSLLHVHAVLLRFWWLFACTSTAES